MHVYVVMGATGEYSDHREWPVCAYFSEEKAKERVRLASERAEEIEAGQKLYEYWRALRLGEIENEYDPEMQMEYNGTGYYYLTVPVEDEK